MAGSHREGRNDLEKGIHPAESLVPEAKEQAVRHDLQEGIHGAHFSIEPDSLVQTVTGNHASSIHLHGSILTVVRVLTRAKKLTLDFFREIITILTICYSDLFMMLIYLFEEGWNHAAIFLPVVYIVFLFMVYKKSKVLEISREALPDHKCQLNSMVDRLDSNKKKIATAFSVAIFVVLYYLSEGNSASENGGNNDGRVPKGKKMALREAFTTIKNLGRATKGVFPYFYLVHVLISGGVKTGVHISHLCAKIKKLPGLRILNLEASATIGCIDTLLCMVDFNNPYPQELIESVKACRTAGIDIILVVGDDLNTGRFIAINSGIIGPEENLENAVIEAAEFLSGEERENRVVNIRLIVNATPADKLLIVQALKQKSIKVAVASNSTRDSPSLKEAAVGIFMGNGTAPVPSEGTDIVLSHNSLTTIADVLKQGRSSFNDVQNFIQLYLIIFMAEHFINFLAAISTGKIFLSQFQIWWVSLMAETLGAFALSTFSLSSAPQASPLIRGASSLTTKTMFSNALFQALYQSIMLLALHFIATAIIHVDETEVSAMIFNIYALCQVFAVLINGELKNPWFLVMVVLMFVLQVTFTCFNPKLSLDLLKWSICFGISALSLPLGWVVKYIPSSA